MSNDMFNLDDFVSQRHESKIENTPEEDVRVKGILDALEAVTTPKAGIDGADGINGVDGVDGVDGIDGTKGIDGIDGLNGADGSDGVSVVDAFVKDDELFTRLSDGKLINAGNVRGPQGLQGPQGSGGGRGYRGGGNNLTSAAVI